jgi:hypothetical protein
MDDRGRVPLGAPFSVPVIDQNTPAARTVPRVYIAPTVAHQETGGQIQAVFGACLEQQARLGLAAIAPVAIVVETGENVVQRQFGPKAGVHRLDGFPRLGSAGNIGLIGDDNEQKPGAFQIQERWYNVREDYEIGNRTGRMRLAIHNYRAVQDSVPVQKHGAIRAPRHRTDSHFV